MSNVIESPRARKAQTRISLRPITYTVDEAAEMLGISRSHAYKCIKAGTLPAMKFGRRLVVPARAVESLLAAGSQLPSLQP